MTQTFQVRPIGVVRSPYARPKATPVQSGRDDTPATVELDPSWAEALADLEGFERIWLLTWLDRAGPFRAKVVPYMDTQPRGLFATRAPCRPNPIGLSVVRLKAVRGTVLEVLGCDALDGTPVPDVKPYAPRFDAFPDSRAGWLKQKRPEGRRADDRFGRP
jgi:tRNA-Thr(GGU) m(6)t(6)A37 methyltransferase TsaA